MENPVFRPEPLAAARLRFGLLVDPLRLPQLHQLGQEKIPQPLHPERVDLDGEMACVVVHDDSRQLIGLGMDEAAGVGFPPQGFALPESRQELLPEEVPVDLHVGKR